MVADMATMAGAARVLAALPEVVEGTRWGGRTWSVGGKAFAWERALSKADIKRLGDQTPPDGPILAVQTADLGEKEAVLAAGHAGVFTVAHFNGYPAVLLQLRVVERTVLRELIVDGWLACAPPALAEQYVRRHRLRPARPDAG
jgi:hypothetical protein